MGASDVASTLPPPLDALPPPVAASLIGLTGALTTVVVGYWQWRRSQAALRELERTKLEIEREKLAWDREKQRLQHRADAERRAWEVEAAHRRRWREAEEAAREQLGKAAREAHSDEELARQYCERLIAELSKLRILDMTRPLDLDSLYVRVRVREDSQHRFASEEEMVGPARGEPAEVVRLGPERGRESGAALAPEEALQRFQRMVVLGDPGAGKTTMLRHLAYRMARGDLPDARLPLYVELRRFVDAASGDLLAFAAGQLDDRYGFPNALPYLDHQLSRGAAVLLLDGLDEVLGGTTAEEAQAAYERVAGEIDRLAARYPSAEIAVTCRRAGWRPVLATFRSLEALDFDSEQVSTFVANWFDDDPERALQLRQTLETNPRMQALAANPLLLSIIAIVFDRDLELPERRAELYNRCVEVLLKEWDAHRGIRRFSRFTTDRKRDLLQEIAWHFHLGGRRYYPEAELLDVIAGFLPTIDIAPEEASAILVEVAAQYGLLKAQAQAVHGFMHLTLQEYFAALAAAAHGADGVDAVVRRRHDPWWEEVLLLLSGRLSDATPLLCAILGRPPERPDDRGPLARRDDLFDSDLLLSARCLAGTPRIGASGLRRRIVDELLSILRSTPYPLTRGRAALALVETGMPDVRYELLRLLGGGRESEAVAVAVAAALGRTMDAAVAGELRRLLSDRADGRGQRTTAAIADALGSLRDEEAIPLLQRHLDADPVIRRSALRALAAIGGPVVVETLAGELDRRQDELGTDWVGRLAALGDTGVRRRVLQVVTAEHGHPFNRLVAAESLRRVADPVIAADCVGLLDDPATPWPVAWLLTEVLDGARAAAVPDLERIGEQTARPELRVAIAAALAMSDRDAGLPLLRDAIRLRLVPPDLTFGRDGSLIGHTWRRVGHALHRLGEDPIVSELVALAAERLRSVEPQPDVVGILAAAERFRPEPLARLVVDHLERRPGRDRVFSDTLLSRTVTTSMASRAVAIVASGRSTYWPATIGAVGAVGADTETIRGLVRLLRARPDAYTTDLTHRALHGMCRRARVRLFPDGSVEQIPG